MLEGVARWRVLLGVRAWCVSPALAKGSARGARQLGHIARDWHGLCEQVQYARSTEIELGQKLARAACTEHVD